VGSFVVGVDGCREGWVACRYEWTPSALSFRVFEAFRELVDNYADAAAIAVDIPIGLRNDWQGRRCDAEARELLGARRSSVFAAPPRSLLAETDYANANDLSREKYGKGLSKQTFWIFNKILEVDQVIDPVLQSRVFEVHPEVCFHSLKNGPLRHSKKRREGYGERLRLLSDAFGVVFPAVEDWRQHWQLGGLGLSRDDAMDAAVAAWSAFRAMRGEADRLPAQPEWDQRGLRMEIVY
jgi:predicted RNase H-like nuclease